jgi:hypothetical protein
VRTGASVLQATVPLPAGFGITFDPETQFVGPDVLSGGSPPRLLRLTRPGSGRSPSYAAARSRPALTWPSRRSAALAT